MSAETPRIPSSKFQIVCSPSHYYNNYNQVPISLYTMPWFQIFQDGPEYEARKRRRTFIPPHLSLKELRQAVPQRLYERSTLKSLGYIFRHILVACFFFYVVNLFSGLTTAFLPWTNFLRPFLWVMYWGWQGMVFSGFWCLGMYAGFFKA